MERREREKLELRSKILDAAREMFITQGYDAVTMRGIAERIEYSPTAIYLHFKDKESLMRDLCVHDFESFAEQFMRLAGVADPVERLVKTGEVYVRFAMEHPQQYRLMFMTPHPPVAPTADEAADPARNGYVFLLATIEQAMAEGRVRKDIKDAQLIAQTVWAATHGLVSLEIAKGCEKGWVDWRPLAKRSRLMVDLILQMFVVEPDKQPGAKKPSSAKRKGA
jgi:AcrR family transcriptional regulator